MSRSWQHRSWSWKALRAADHLNRVSDIDCEIIDLNCVSHPDKAMILESVRKTGKLLVADTSWQAYGVCAEICRIVCEADPAILKAPCYHNGYAARRRAQQRRAWKISFIQTYWTW